MMPVTCGCVAGVVAPAGMKTLAGVTVTLEVSVLLSVTVTPPAGASGDKATANTTDWPIPSVTFAGRLIPPWTVTFAVVSARLGGELA